MKKIIPVFIITMMIFSMFTLAYCEDIITANSNQGKEIVKFQDTNLEKVIRSIINKPEGDILANEVKYIKKLHASDKNITSLQGIDKLINLEELLLSKNNITDITPISGLNKLKYLNLWENNINDITPIVNLVNLEQLDLDSNEIKNIDSLKQLYNLKALRLGSNKLIDISALSDLTNLEYLCLWANKIVNVEPISNLEKLTELRLAYNEISDITPLANLNNLENLNLINNKIRDISPLINLTNLKTLYLINNEIKNIEPLSQLINIERLRIDDNNISDIKSLEMLINLKLLTLSKNEITDITPLKGMNKIEWLDLKSNGIMDISVLKDIITLEKLFLDENNIYNINALSNKNKLIILSLSHNNIWDMRSLDSLVNLRSLDLSSNDIKTLQPLNKLPNLTMLYLDDNDIFDISGLKDNVNLKNLSLQNNAVKNIDNIANLINLENLNLAGNQISNINSLKNNSKLKILKLHNNQITDFSPLYALGNLEVIRTIDYLTSGTITVSGKVTDMYNDESKGVDTYVTMISLTENNNRFYTDVTDEWGEFKIQGVFPGEYKIVFTNKGYKPLTVYKTINSSNKEINEKIELASNTQWISKETERTVYNYKNGINISDDEIRLQEKRLMEIEQFFNVEMKDKINFYICKYPNEIYQLAYNTKDYYALGTYKSSTNSLYTVGKAFDFHETCHAVEHQFNPNYNIPMGEGLAIYFGNYEIGSPMVLNRPVDDLARELMIKGELKDINTLLKNFDGANDYISNGSLVTFLLKNYSAQQFKDLFKMLPNKPTEQKIESVFMEIFNKSVKEIQVEWLNYLKDRTN